MNRYQVLLEESAKKALRSLDQALRLRIGKAIDRLELDPYPPGMKSLKGLSGVFRLRVGEYRILYAVQGSRLVVLVLKIGHRRDVYRGI